MSELKWANVAHHYATSEIEVARVFHDEFLDFRIGSRADFDYDAWHTWRRGLSDLTIKEMTPVLRALEDMAEEEAQDLWTLVTGEEWVNDSDETALQVSRMSLGKAILKFNEDTTTLSICIGNPIIWNWLCSKGFDVFGLIESGQAIRKEVQP